MQPQGGLRGVDPEAFCSLSSEYLFTDPAIAVQVLEESRPRRQGGRTDKQPDLSRILLPYENGAVDVVLTTHADDFLWACTKSGHAVVDRLLTRFEVGRREEGQLRFCG